MSHRSSLFAASFLVVLLVTPAAASTNPKSGEGFLRLRGGIVFPDPDRDPGPGWLAGGALGLPLNQNVVLSMNYDHVDLDTPGDMRSVNPLTAQLELGAPTRGGIVPRVSLGAGFYDIKVRDRVTFVPVGGFVNEYRSPRNVPFGMSVGGGVSIPLSARTMFDLDLRYHQTMGFNTLVMGTVGAGISYKLGGGDEETWASR